MLGTRGFAYIASIIIAIAAINPIEVKAGPIYSVKDLGIHPGDELGPGSSGQIYVDNNGQVGYGLRTTVGSYTLGYQNSQNGPEPYITDGKGESTIIPGLTGQNLPTALAYGLNSNGLVVGQLVGNAPSRAFIYDVNNKNNTPVLIPLVSQLFTSSNQSYNDSPYPAQHSVAFGINDQGIVVGCTGINFSNILHAFIHQNNMSIDLNQLISSNTPFSLTSAVSINNSGEIAGYAIDSQGNTHEVLLIPNTTPEPGTLIISATGLGMAMIWRKRRIGRKRGRGRKRGGRKRGRR